jgi:chitinase
MESGGHDVLNLTLPMMKPPLLILSLFLSSCLTPNYPETFELDGRKVIGYWHNWNSRQVPYMPLSAVPSYVNQVNLAFAFPDTPASKRLTFPHIEKSDAAIKSGIRTLQRRGIDVLLSVGGGNHPIELETEKERDDFASSLIRLVNFYGFDGVDINLEGKSMVLNPGDTDFRNPTTPKIQHLIQAIEMVDNHYRQRLILSVAPETVFVHGGYAKYGEGFGGYLPVLYHLRDRLDLVHVQLYNSGSMFAYTGDPGVPPTLIVERGTVDFVVALTEMMILGFPVANDPEAWFPGFPAEKIVVGLPSMPIRKGSGTLTNRQFRLAMTRLLTGKADYDAAYEMRSRNGHPNLKGVMTWSLNWDVSTERGRRQFDFVRTANEVLEDVLKR